eukprot:NODE_535_length_927_cov_937.431663_g350_i0.p1 GENE.NODE_535_length_927_cov_937.431663_g350_i0~~NODE_535_length_927_cov_937.431663_g350_i0.p1  ORF type:complete len:235 (-),score=39.45 NODE_535_length_927_cov_937.431663_g350_i0:148-852(-)
MSEIQSVLWDDRPPSKDDLAFHQTSYAPQAYQSPGTPASLSAQTGSFQTYAPSAPFDEEDRPLLEELGIDFAHIKRKARLVCNPFKPFSNLDDMTLQDADLAGPLFFCLSLGVALLLGGKLHFGYIYGFGMVGCLALYALLNAMCDRRAVSFQYIVSILGYCLFPIVLLGILSSLPFVSPPSWLGYPIAVLFIAWSGWCATKMFVEGLEMREQKWLILYPVVLLYSTFALISVF